MFCYAAGERLFRLDFHFRGWHADGFVAALPADEVGYSALTAHFLAEDGFVLVDGGSGFIVFLGGRLFRFAETGDAGSRTEFHRRCDEGGAVGETAVNVVTFVDFHADRHLAVAVGQWLYGGGHAYRVAVVCGSGFGQGRCGWCHLAESSSEMHTISKPSLLKRFIIGLYKCGNPFLCKKSRLFLFSADDDLFSADVEA